MERVQFGPIVVNAPSQVMPYLYRVYGEDCMTKAVFQPTYSTRFKRIPKGKVEIVDFEPAKYIIRKPLRLE